MSALLTLHANLEAIGDAQESDFDDLPNGTPRAFFTVNGMPVMLVGLSRDECRGLAAALFSGVEITVRASELGAAR